MCVSRVLSLESRTDRTYVWGLLDGLHTVVHLVQQWLSPNGKFKNALLFSQGGQMSQLVFSMSE